MRVIYDTRADSLHRSLTDSAEVAESNEASPGVILDYDADGNVVSIEILDASRRVTDAGKVEFTVATS